MNVIGYYVGWIRNNSSETKHNLHIPNRQVYILNKIDHHIHWCARGTCALFSSYLDFNGAAKLKTEQNNTTDCVLFHTMTKGVETVFSDYAR